MFGAAFGRLYGEIFTIILSFFGFSPVNPLGYAGMKLLLINFFLVVGAAAMASGVTRTLSTGVIVRKFQIQFLIF